MSEANPTTKQITPVEATPVDQANPAPQTMFPEVTRLEDCTYLECLAGHRYTPAVALAKCGYGTSQGWVGCGTPVLAVKQTLCPQCNEPSVRLHLRIDHTAPVPFPVPMCIPKAATNAEVIILDIPLKAHLNPYPHEKANPSNA